MTAITAAFSIPALTAPRGTFVATGSSAATTPVNSSSDSANSTAADEAVQTLRGLEDEAAATRKEIARQKLERARENMTILRQFGLSSDFVARRAAEIGKELGAAASDFAAAMGSARQFETVLLPQNDEATDTDIASLPEAYREILETGTSSVAHASEDWQTIDQFHSALFDVRAVLEWSLDDARREDDDPLRDFTGRRALAGIDGALLALDNIRSS